MASRTRNRTVTAFTGTSTGFNRGVYVRRYSLSKSYSRTMTDTIGSKALMKPCSSSEKRIISLVPASADMAYNSSIPVVSTVYGSIDICRLEGGLIDTPDLVHLSVITQDQLNRSHADVYSNLRPKVQLVNTLIDIATFRSIFENVFQRLSKSGSYAQPPSFLSKKKRTQFYSLCEERGVKGAKRFLKSLSNNYLMYSFGIAPLLRDIDELAKVTAEFLYRKVPRPTVETFHGHSTTYSPPVVDELVIPGTYSFLCSRTRYTKCTATQTVKVQWETDHLSDHQYALKKLENQLGLHALFGTVWEAVPFSFIADWLMPTKGIVTRMDDYLSYRPRFTILDSCSSEKRETVCHLAAKSVQTTTRSPFDYLVMGRLGEVTYAQVEYTRSAPSSIPLGYFSQVPGLDGKKVSYLGALAIQRI